MVIWRLHLKSQPSENISRKDVLQFCISNKIIGVGWPEVDTRSGNYEDINKQVIERYSMHHTSCIKALNAMNSMKTDDLIWTRLDGIYYLCKVGKKLWVDCKPTGEHENHDVTNFVETEWVRIGTEEMVPGKVASSFSPQATVQKVNNVEIISKFIWNNYKKSSDYIINTIPNDDIWHLLSSEMVEEIVLIYLQKEYNYMVYTSTVKSSTSKIECVLVRSDGDHRCYPQVKTGNVSLNSNEYMDLLSNERDIICLFTTSEKYVKNNSPQVKYIAKSELEEFIKLNSNLLPPNMQFWFKIVGYI